MHFFIKFQGYGISKRILDQTRINGVALVCINELTASQGFNHWLSYLDSWFVLGNRYTFENDEQRILPLRRMWKEDEEPSAEVEAVHKRQSEIFNPYSTSKP